MYTWKEVMGRKGDNQRLLHKPGGNVKCSAGGMDKNVLY